jgi:hypothetical protein
MCSHGDNDSGVRASGRISWDKSSACCRLWRSGIRLAAAALFLSALGPGLPAQQKQSAANAPQAAATTSAPPQYNGAWAPIGPKPTSPATSGSGTSGQTSGRVTAIAVDPTDPTGNTVFAGGAQGGVWETTTGGVGVNGNPGWTPLTDGQPSLAMGSLAIAVDPSNSLDSRHRVIYAGTGEETGTGFDAYYGAGILKSLNGGITWTQTCSGTAFTNSSCPFVGPFSNGFVPGGGARIGSLGVNPGNPDQLLAAVQIFSGSDISGQAGQPGIYCTNNAGAAWTRIVPTGLTTTAMATTVVYASSTTAFAAIGRVSGDPTNGIYETQNANEPCASQTWTLVTGINSVAPQARMGRIALAIAPGNSNVIYAAIADASTDSDALLGVFASANGGASWSETNAPDFCASLCWRDLVIQVDPADATGNTVFAGGSNATDANGNPLTLIRSTNGGSTWSSFAAINQDGAVLPAGHHAVAFTSNGSVMYAGNDGGVWSSTNAALTNTAAGSQTWTGLNFDLAVTQFYAGFSIHPSTPTIAFGGTQDNGSQTYSGSTDWTNIGTCTDGGFSVVDPFVPTTTMVACSMTTAASIFRSDTSGAPETFSAATSGISTSDSLYPVPPLVPDPSNAGRYYFGTNQLYQTTNLGGNWTMISCHASNCSEAGAGDLTGGGGAALTTIAISASNPAVVYVGASDATVQMTQNASAGGTAAFTKINSGLPSRTVTKILVDPGDPSGNTAYVTFSGFAIDQSVSGGAVDLQGHIFKTTSGGAPAQNSATGWTDISCHVADCSAPLSTDLPNFPVNDLVMDLDDPNHTTLYAATDIGAYVTTNGGASWTALGTALPDVAVLSLALHEPSRTLRAATHGRSVWDYALPALALTPSFALSSLAPVSAAGDQSAPFTLTLAGRGFTASSTVLWNGSASGISISSETATSLVATVPASLLAQAGEVNVQVMDTSQSPDTTNALIFSVTGSTPALISVTPSSVMVGASNTPITITGSNFTQNAQATINNTTSGITTNAVNSAGAQMTATLSQTLLQYGAEAFIGVTNPPPGGGTASPQLLFIVNNPDPPGNNDFVNATPITTGSFTNTEDTFAATTETADPAPSCASMSGNPDGKPVWWVYTAGSAGTISINTMGSAYDTVVDVFTGSQGSLTEIPSGCSHGSGGAGQSQVQFGSVAGTTYYIMVTVYDLTQCPPAGNSVIECGGKLVFNFSGATPAGVSGSPTTASISAGGSATFTISTLAPPLSGQVTLTVSGCPPLSTCTIAASPITAGTSTTLTVTTTAVGSCRVLPGLRGPQEPPSFWLACALGLVILLAGWLCFVPRERRLAALLPVGTLLVLLAFSAGCAIGTTDVPIPGTPAASYSLVITATGNGNTTATTTVTLTVN